MWITFKKPIIILAPMADMTDGPFCRICRDVSGKDFVIFREMVSSEAIVRGSAKTLKMCEFEKKERPLVIQIFGSKSETMAEAAKIIATKFKPDGIDINMGCPVPKITGKNFAGSALMKDPKRASEIVRAIKAENLGVPITVKTRLGWNKEDEILEFAKVLQEAGADAITVHGRTKAQGYAGKANWGMIAKVKNILQIPVIANGDIVTTQNIADCLQITKADGVMIGRGALGNPWIFNFEKQFSTEEKIKIILHHAQAHVECYGERFINTFRKHLAYYLTKSNFPDVENIKELRMRAVRINSLEEIKDLFSFKS